MSINICRDYENKFRELADLTWRPWVGVNYNASEKDRLLVVGESHYIWTNPSETSDEVEIALKDFSFTRCYINENGLWGKNSVLLRNIERVLSNSKSINKQKQQGLWNSVSFYNFIQRPLKSREGKDRPTHEDWEIAWNTFFKVVDILRPTHILFCGVEAANAFHELEKSMIRKDFKVAVWKKDKVGRTNLRVGSISHTGEAYSANAVFMAHPSSYFSWSKWAKCIEGKITVRV